MQVPFNQLSRREKDSSSMDLVVPVIVTLCVYNKWTQCLGFKSVDFTCNMLF